MAYPNRRVPAVVVIRNWKRARDKRGRYKGDDKSKHLFFRNKMAQSFATVVIADVFHYLILKYHKNLNYPPEHQVSSKF